MNNIIEVNNSHDNFQLSVKKVLDEITSNDDREELIYTIIDACPYDFGLNTI